MAGLHFRRTCRPWRAILKIAPAFSGFAPSMAGHPENCSCIFRICAVHGGHKKTRHVGRVFVDSCEECATGYPALKRHGSGRRARDVMPAAMRALVTICGWAATRDIGSLALWWCRERRT
jgi:hypothetical protein